MYLIYYKSFFKKSQSLCYTIYMKLFKRKKKPVQENETSSDIENFDGETSRPLFMKITAIVLAVTLLTGIGIGLTFVILDLIG